MKVAMTAICLALVAAEAQAISRYASTSLTCEEIQAAIQSEGKAFLSWRARDSRLPLFGNFIANRRFCSSEQGTEAAYVPARNEEFCAVRKCVDLDLSDGRSK